MSGQNKECGTGDYESRPNFAMEILKRKNLDSDLRREVLAKEASDNAAKPRKLSTGELDMKRKKASDEVKNLLKQVQPNRDGRTDAMKELAEAETEGKMLSALRKHHENRSYPDSPKADDGFLSKWLSEEVRSRNNYAQSVPGCFPMTTILTFTLSIISKPIR